MKASLKSFYERTVLFNQLAGKVASQDPDSNQFRQDMINQIERVEEELKELKEAVETNDKLKILDGVVDVNVCSLYMGELLFEAGYKIDGANLAVANNNLTKITENHSIAATTVEKYGEESCYIDSVIRDGTIYYCVKRLLDNKILKPSNYVSVSLGKFLP
jgi:hypothetical protein